MSSSTSSSDSGPLLLLARVVLFALIPLAVMVGCLWWGPHVSRVDYLAGMRAKHERLRTLASPKVILIGGSNVTFGMDSPLLEKAARRPVVNMSIHASLGFHFMVQELKGGLGAGDIVIAPLEHFAYAHPVLDNDIHLLAVDFNPELLGELPVASRPRIVAGVLVMRLKAAWKVINGAWQDDSPHPFFRADGFNAQGDLVSHLGLPEWPETKQERVPCTYPVIDPVFWEVLAELQRDVDDANSTLIMTWPSIAQSSFDQACSDSIRSALEGRGIPMLGEARMYVQPDSAFFDTHHHLRAAGRRSRTVQLINDLCSSGRIVCYDRQMSP